MKKIGISTIFLSMFLFTVNVSAATLDKKVGNVYSSDIVAKIDGMEIPSYNIGGKTVVSEWDLINYGFSTKWEAEGRCLYIDTAKLPVAAPKVNNTKRVSGKTIGMVYATDITVFLNGIEIDGYNIGGQTMIALEDMASRNKEVPCSDVNEGIGYSSYGFRTEWNQKTRTISLFSLRSGGKVKVDGREYQIDEMISGYALDYVVLKKISEDTEEFLRGINNYTSYISFRRANCYSEAYYSEEILKAAFYKQWEIKDGVLYITVLKESPSVILDSSLSREQKTKNYNAGFEVISISGATKAMTPVAIPYITIPAKINIAGTVIDAKVRGAVIYGEILVDAEQVLNLTGGGNY